MMQGRLGLGNFEIENSFSTIHDITLLDPPGSNFAWGTSRRFSR